MNERKRTEALEVLKRATEMVQSTDTIDVFIAVAHVGGNYLCYSSSMDDTLAAIGQIELTKLDALHHLLGNTNEPNKVH